MVQNMNILNKKIRPISLFYLCFVMYTISNSLTLTNFRNNESLFIYPIYLYIRVICAIILAIIIISNKQIRIKLIFLFPLIIFLGLSTYFSESWNLALLVLFAIASDGVDVKKIAKILIIIYGSILALTSLSARLGIIPSYPIKGDGGLVRDPMGFTHPNTFSSFVVVVCCAFAIIRFKKFNLLDLLVQSFGFFLCWSIAYSRTSSICIVFILVISMIFSLIKSKNIHKAIYTLMAFLFLIECIFSLYLMIHYTSSSPWMSNLNRLFSGRLELADYFYSNFGINPFGFDYSKIQIFYNGYTSFVVDNAFCHIILESGYIVAVIFYIMYFLAIIRARKTGLYSLNAYGLILYVPVAFCEMSAFLVCFNFALLSVFKLVGKSIQYSDDHVLKA